MSVEAILDRAKRRETPKKTPKETLALEKSVGAYELEVSLAISLLLKKGASAEKIREDFKTLALKLKLSDDKIQAVEKILHLSEDEIRLLVENALMNIEEVDEDHELYHAFESPEQLEKADLKTMQVQAVFMRILQRKVGGLFRESVLREENPLKRAKCLKDFLTTYPERLVNSELAAKIFNIFRAAGDHEAAIAFYDHSVSIIFKKSPLIQEFLAISLYESTVQSLSLSDEEKARRIERSRTIIHHLIKEGRANGQVYTILGLTASSHQKSLEAFEQGFQHQYEYGPGIQLLFGKIQEAAEQKNPGLLNDIFALAELVALSAEKAGGMASHDFRTMMALLEANILSGKKIVSMKMHFETTLTIPDIDLALKDLKTVQANLKLFLGISGCPQGITSMLETIDTVLVKLSEQKKIIEQKRDPTRKLLRSSVIDRRTARQQATEKILDMGFSYGEIASFVGGNIEFSGGLHDHVVNRWDIEIAKDYLKKTGLDQCDQFEDFNTSVDKLIRARFETAALENLQSKKHKDFDQTALKMNALLYTELYTTAPRTTDDSRTNVMLDFFLGLGDCRQHAYVKQLLFDVWKAGRMNHLLMSADEALQQGDMSTFAAMTDKARKLSRTLLMVFDTEIQAPIKIKKKYEVERDASGAFLKSDRGEALGIEDHTWNGLVELDEQGEVKTLTMTDSFYHSTYDFQHMSINPDDIIKGYFLPKATVTAKNPDGSLEPVEIKLKPLRYSKSRRRGRLKSAYLDDLGEDHILLRGHVITGFTRNGEKQNAEGFFKPSFIDAVNKFKERLRTSPHVVMEKNIIPDTLTTTL